MKFQKIFAMEFGYQIRRPIIWICFALLGVLAFLIVIGNYLDDARDGYFLLNAPIIIAAVTVICSVKWLLIGASVAGNAATRDLQTRMYALTYTIPTTKAVYLGGRFTAAFALNTIMVLAIPVGIVVAMQFWGVEAAILGPFRLNAYLSAFFYILLPNAFLATAIQFSIAILTRRAMASYLAGTLLFAAAYLSWMMLPDKGVWKKLVDPMAFGQVLNYLTIEWTPLETSTRLLLPEGTFLANRLLWLSIAVMFLLSTWLVFDFILPERRRKNVAGESPLMPATDWKSLISKNNRATPVLERTFGSRTEWRQFRSITWRLFLQLAKSKAGAPLLAILAFLVAFSFRGNLKARGVPVLPGTDFVLDLLTAPLAAPGFFWIIIVLLIIFYAGELLWRDRDARLSDIAYTMPVPEWMMFFSRYAALSLVLLLWLFLLAVAGITTQIILGGAAIEVVLYLKILLGMQWVDCLLFAMLALFIHVLVNHKYVGHLVALLAYGCIVFAGKLGLEYKLLIYSAAPHWSYTSMAGFGNTVAPWLWFKFYWMSWALLLAVTGWLFWVRNHEVSFASRLQLARRRFSGSPCLVLILALAGILTAGGFIFYNTHLLHPYTNSTTVREQQAEYEKLYGQYANSKQPQLTGVQLQVDIYPVKRTVDIAGIYRLVNNSQAAIDTIHIATATAVETTAIQFDRPFTTILADRKLGHCMYLLAKPILPGDSIRFSFRVNIAAQGFTNNGAEARVQANGTSFRNYEWFPAIGYQPHRELDEAGDRKAYGLTARPAMASLYHAAAHEYAPFPEQISFDALVSTDADQVVVAPGALHHTWTSNGRRYFHYVTDAPIRNEYSFFSARYAMQQLTWHNPLPGGDRDVDIQVYYPPGRTENIERMLSSAMASLAHYSKEFGPYPHRQLRFVAHASHAFGHHAAPVNTTAEESFFLLNPKKDPRGFDLVTAVVAHETAHQWWGNMLKAAQVEGAGLVTESLAWYSALGVMEDAYGPEQLDRLLEFLREENETPRSPAALPLLQANGWYQYYRKGPLALYALSQYMGREKVNGALRNLLANHRPGSRPFATSLDLFRELQAVTPDTLQPLLYDLFKANTFWELGTEAATAKKYGHNSWQVELRIQAKKWVVDSAGTAILLPMNEWVEVGVFASAEPGKETGRVLYRQKHRVTSGKQTIIVTVPGQPAKVGIDPRNLLIDWNANDNFKVIHPTI